MNEALIFVLVWIAGGLLGTFFFGGLWWTVRKGMSSRRPALWFFGSLLVRMSIALAGFYLIGRDHWGRLLVCLLGFVMARLVIVWITRPSKRALTCAKEEAFHAP